MKVLVSDISSFKAIGICRFLKENYGNVNIYSFDTRPFTRYFHTKYSDKHYIIERNAYLDSVFNILRKDNIDLFIPIYSNEMDMVLQNKHKAEKALAYWGSYESFGILNDKDRLYELARELNINVPERYNNIEESQVNCVIKPVTQSSARGVRYFFNQKKLDEAKSSLGSKKDIIIQEYIQGEGIGYSVFAKNGKIITGFGHKRLAEYPISGGSSVYRESYENEEIRAISEKILIATKWSGFAMFEFKLTPDNEIYLIEVNPRIWGSINQGLQNGINYFEDILGKATFVTKFNKGNINTYLSPLIYLSFLKYLQQLNFRPLLTFIGNVSHNRADINMFCDFKGWFGTILRKLI